MQLHNLGAVHEAAAGEGDQVGLLGAPAGQRRRPLARPAKLRGLLAPVDHAAVDDAGDDRRELAGGHGHHRLVQEPDPTVELSEPHEVVPLVDEGECQEVGIAVALGDGRRLARDVHGARPVAGLRPAERVGEREVALFHALAAGAVDQALRATDPARPAADLAAQRQVDPEPPAGPRGAERLAVLDVRVMGALEDGQVFLVTAEHVRRRREQLEIVGAQRRLCVGARQLLVRLSPRPPVVREAAALEQAGGRGSRHGSNLAPTRSVPLAAGEAAEGDQADEGDDEPEEKLQKTAIRIPTITMIPPSVIPPLPYLRSGPAIVPPSYAVAPAAVVSCSPKRARLTKRPSPGWPTSSPASTITLPRTRTTSGAPVTSVPS